MRYTIESKINDGMAEAPPVTVEICDDSMLWVEELLDHVREELANEYGEPFGVGGTVVITRAT